MLNENILSDFNDLPQTNPNAVLLGDMQESLNFPTLNQVYHLLKSSPEIRFLSLSNQPYYKSEGQRVFDGNSILATLENLTGKKAEFLGKPSLPFYKFVLSVSDCRPEESVVISDDYDGDLKTAASLGIRTLPITTPNWSAPPNSESQTFRDFSESVDWILSNSR